MKDIPIKVDGISYLYPEEWNSIASEMNNYLASANVTPSSADEYQFAESSAYYSMAADFYNDAGTNFSYILSPQGKFKAPSTYINGMRVRFKASNTNEGSVTVNVNNLGIKNIKNYGNIDLVAEEISKDNYVELVYDGDDDCFYVCDNISNLTKSSQVVFNDLGTSFVDNAIASFDANYTWGSAHHVSMMDTSIIPIYANSLIIIEVSTNISLNVPNRKYSTGALAMYCNPLNSSDQPIAQTYCALSLCNVDSDSQAAKSAPIYLRKVIKNTDLLQKDIKFCIGHTYDPNYAAASIYIGAYAFLATTIIKVEEFSL